MFNDLAVQAVYGNFPPAFPSSKPPRTRRVWGLLCARACRLLIGALAIRRHARFTSSGAQTTPSRRTSQPGSKTSSRSPQTPPALPLRPTLVFLNGA